MVRASDKTTIKVCGTSRVPENHVQCIICGKNILREKKKLYQQLEHFPDFCFCKQCLKTEYLPGKTELDYGR